MPKCYIGPFLSVSAPEALSVPGELSALVMDAFGRGPDGRQSWVARQPLPGTQIFDVAAAPAMFGLHAKLLDVMRFQAVTEWSPVLQYLERQPGVKYAVCAGVVWLP